MEFSNQETATIKKAIAYWQANHIIDDSTGALLNNQIPTNTTPKFAPLSVYAFIIAGSSAVLAFATLVLDAEWLEKLRQAWSFSELFVGILFLIISILLIVYRKKNNQLNTNSQVANETFNIGIFFTICIAITYLGRALAWNNNYYTAEMAIISLLLLLTASILSSKLLWIFGLISATVWYATQTYIWGNEQHKFLGMNYPLRSAVWSIIIYAAGCYLPSKLSQFKKPTTVIGIISFLFAAWTLSIFGNWSSIEKWEGLHQSNLWYWALLFTLLLVLLFIVALKKKNDFLRDSVIAFFVLNLYTRYFEYFWDNTNKGLFFAILAVSFWLIGKQIEKFRHRNS